MKLAARDPTWIQSPMVLLGLDRVLDALPAPGTETDPLPADLEVVRERLLRHQPAVGVHRANQRRFEALARSERARRLPSLRFVDVGFEPVAFPGSDRQWTTRVAIDVPFGRQARAETRRYQALARAERSGELSVVEIRLREAQLALGEINDFRRRSRHWLELASLADAAEGVADRWGRNRLTDPGQISNLLDAVYSARLAVLDSRERAGLAGCAVISATGLSVDEWR